jgi:hypothetical protein
VFNKGEISSPIDLTSFDYLFGPSYKLALRYGVYLFAYRRGTVRRLAMSSEV